MSQLVIIGAGGLGREAFYWAQDCGFAVKGFLDANPDALRDFGDEYAPILGTPETYQPTADERFVCAIGTYAFRVRCVQAIRERGGLFVSVIHPKATCYSTPGVGALIAPNAYIATNARIGEFLFAQVNSVIGHDTSVGDFCRFDVDTFAGGFSKIGSGVTLYTGSKVLPAMTVGDEATVGAGSIVLSSVKAKTTVFGAPAKPIRF